MQKQTRRRRPRRRLTAIFDTAAVALFGMITARLVLMTIDVIAARNGSPPGGEIFLVAYAFILPLIGWRLRGAWDRAIKRAAQTQKRKEQQHEHHQQSAY